MRLHPRTWLCVCVLTLAVQGLLGCSPPLSSEGYLRVEVRASAEARAACLRVIVRTPAGTVERSSPIARPASSTEPFVVAVYQDALGPEVSVEAVGFTDMAGCDTELAPPEHSETWTGHFTPQVVTTVQLTIAPPYGDAGVDAGSGDAGAADAGPHDAGAADAGAEDAGPLDAGASDAGAVDAGLADAGADAGRVDGGSADAGAGDAGAADAGVEVCTDGVDNDHDGLVDCQDPDCAMRACSDFSACTTGDVCMGTSCVGAPMDCAVGLLVCTINVGCDAGVCLAAPAPVNTGTCDDGFACTVSDSCDGDGGCQGTPKTCPTSTHSCLLPTCSEPSGSCGFTVDVGAGCDDSNACTTGDQCLADGGCGGTLLQCPVQSECQSSGACTGGTCVYAARSGPCDGGTCNGLGQCVPNAATFNYTPSNFTEAQLATVTAANVSVNCAVTIDTQTADGGIGVTATGCQAPVFGLRVITQGTGFAAPSAAVLVSNDLDLASGGSLTIVGARPAIFAVRGNANLNGPITTSAAVDLNCAFAVKDGAMVTRGGGGGGGGFGTAGGNGAWAGGNLGGGGVGTSGNQTLTPLKGGCSGGAGGGGSVAGRGGGAVQVSAAGDVSVNSAIAANGTGGAGAAITSRGGGGGGSGGGVLLEGQRITLNAQAVLVANGGGGGEGSESTAGAPGSPGLSSSMNAPGGSNSSFCGGNGGRGGALTTPSSGGGPGGTGCGVKGGGGGGGGGSGYLRLNAVNGCTVNSSATVSPGRTGSGSGC